MNDKKQRTKRQNASMYKYFDLLSQELNSAGLDMLKVMKEREIPWTPISIKEVLWRDTMKTMFGKTSTKDLTTKEMTETYEAINRVTSELGVSVYFPSQDDLRTNP